MRPGHDGNVGVLKSLNADSEGMGCCYAYELLIYQQVPFYLLPICCLVTAADKRCIASVLRLVQASRSRSLAPRILRPRRPSGFLPVGLNSAESEAEAIESVVRSRCGSDRVQDSRRDCTSKVRYSRTRRGERLSYHSSTGCLRFTKMSKTNQCPQSATKQSCTGEMPQAIRHLGRSERFCQRVQEARGATTRRGGQNASGVRRAYQGAAPAAPRLLYPTM